MADNPLTPAGLLAPTYRIRVKKASYTPYVVWSESCPFSKELGKLTKTECTEAGGNRTLVKDGQSYSM